MQQLADRIYIETCYPGVTLGAISGEHGLILIDAPFRNDDIKNWRNTLLTLSGGVDRILINLDAHFDRTLGARAMECTVIGHEKTAQVFRSRPVTFKTTSSESGSDWEQHSGLGSIRWLPPEISFTDRLCLHWDDRPICLEHRPGPDSGAIWAVLPEQHILFAGDAVVIGQPPYLAAADIPTWLDTLSVLVSPQYSDYLVVSGRGGLAAASDIRKQIEFLTLARTQIDALVDKKAEPEDTAFLLPGLLKFFQGAETGMGVFEQRLKSGLYHYYQRHYRPVMEDIIEE